MGQTVAESPLFPLLKQIKKCSNKSLSFHNYLIMVAKIVQITIRIGDESTTGRLGIVGSGKEAVD